MRLVLAYLDPGTGSYLLQLALGGFFGIVYAVSHFWTRVKQLLGRGARSSPDDAFN